MSAPYLVYMGDAAGPAGDQRCATWAEALCLAEDWARRYPHNSIEVQGDGADYATDTGFHRDITDDEQDEFDEAIERGRSAGPEPDDDEPGYDFLEAHRDEVTP